VFIAQLGDPGPLELPLLAVACLLGHEPDIDQCIEEALSDGKNPGASRQMITQNLAESGPSLDRKQPPGAGNSREPPAAADNGPRPRFRWPGVVSAGSGRCWVRTNVG
jgi:hypothetical protein